MIMDNERALHGCIAPVVQEVDNSIDFDGTYLVSSDFSSG